MIPILLGILAGMADGGRNVLAAARTDVDRLTLTMLGLLFALPYYAIWLTFTGIPEVDPRFWRVIAAAVPLLAIAFVWMVEAYRGAQLTEVGPLHGLLPALLLITTPLMAQIPGLALKESGLLPLNPRWPAFAGGAGVLVAVSGIYSVLTRTGKMTLSQPFRKLFEVRGLRIMCGVLAIFSITSNLDALGFKYSNAPFYLLVVHGLTAVVLAIAALFFIWTGRAQFRDLLPIKKLDTALLYGLLTAGSVIPHIEAFRWTNFVPYVIVGKRTGSLFIQTRLALKMAVMPRWRKQFAAESEGLIYKLAGIALVLIGITIVVVWGKGI